MATENRTVCFKKPDKFTKRQLFFLLLSATLVVAERFLPFLREVKRNEEVPFLVKTNSLLVKVLGTKFNFRDYPDDAEAIVSLSEGKVALNNLLKKEKEAFLLPNERVVLNKKNGRMHVEYSTVSNALQWTNGYLFFDEELLPDVVKELERSYNVKIQIASDTLNTFRFYGNFVHREQNIQEVLEALSATRKIHYIIEGHNITLY